MNLLAIFVIAAALAIDAFGVALAFGIRLRRVTLSRTLQIGGVFGGFHFLMPVIGWWLGTGAHKYIEPYAHWVAFALFSFVGVRMIREAWKNKGAASHPDAAYNPAHTGILLLLGIAISLDALAVGLSFAFLRMDIRLPAAIIGIVCFFISVIGLHLGRFTTRLPKLGALSNQLNIVAGMVLVVIGIQILQQHGVF